MISARQELDLRPQLEGLDRLILRSEGIEPGALTFAFRPLWQLDAPAKAALALSKAQATAVYAGLGLWPAATTARLVEAQLVEDGVYPNAAAVFAEAESAADGAMGTGPTLDFDPAQPRDPQGRWTSGGGGSATSSPKIDPTTVAGGSQFQGSSPQHSSGFAQLHRSGLASGRVGFFSMLNPIGTAWAQERDPDESREVTEEPAELAMTSRNARYNDALQSLKAIDPSNQNLSMLEPSGYIPTEAEIARVEAAAKEAAIARTCDFPRPDGQPIGQRGRSSKIRIMSGGLAAAQRDFDYLGVGGTGIAFDNGSMVRLPGGAGTVTLRPITSTPASPAIDINIPHVIQRKLHY